eukprot:366229-Chlamydomonas_euryale.AAC.17
MKTNDTAQHESLWHDWQQRVRSEDCKRNPAQFIGADASTSAPASASLHAAQGDTGRASDVVTAIAQEELLAELRMGGLSLLDIMGDGGWAAGELFEDGDELFDDLDEHGSDDENNSLRGKPTSSAAGMVVPTSNSMPPVDSLAVAAAAAAAAPAGSVAADTSPALLPPTAAAASSSSDESDHSSGGSIFSSSPSASTPAVYVANASHDIVRHLNALHGRSLKITGGAGSITSGTSGTRSTSSSCNARGGTTTSGSTSSNASSSDQGISMEQLQREYCGGRSEREAVHRQPAVNPASSSRLSRSAALSVQAAASMRDDIRLGTGSSGSSSGTLKSQLLLGLMLLHTTSAVGGGQQSSQARTALAEHLSSAGALPPWLLHLLQTQPERLQRATRRIFAPQIDAAASARPGTVLRTFWEAVRASPDGMSTAARLASSGAANEFGAPATPASRYRTDFQELSRLGKGGFGVVVAAINR